jgi:hypothetical protein
MILMAGSEFDLPVFWEILHLLILQWAWRTVHFIGYLFKDRLFCARTIKKKRTKHGGHCFVRQGEKTCMITGWE